MASVRAFREKPEIPSMVRLRVLPVAEWGFGRQEGVKVLIPRPPGTGGSPPIVPAAIAGAPNQMAFANAGLPNRGMISAPIGMARYGFPGPFFPQRGGGRRYRLVFPGQNRALSASADRPLRTLFLVRPRYNRPSRTPAGARLSAGVPGSSVYHEIHLPSGASVSEGMLARLATEGEGWRLGPVVAVRFDAVMAVPE